MLIIDQLKKNDPQLRLLSACFLAGMAALLTGLWFLQIYSSKRYQSNLEEQSFRTVRIPAMRGKILDRNGFLLSENRPSYNVNLYLEELRPTFQETYRRHRPPGRLTRDQIYELSRQTRFLVVSNTALHVSSVIDLPIALEERRFKQHYEQRLALPFQLVDSLNAEQVARFWEDPPNVPGLDLEVQPVRYYPYRSTAAHLIGYLQRDDSAMSDIDASFNYRLPDFKGAIGIEGAFDEDLRGRAGVKSVLVNNLGYRQSESIWTTAEPGNNVVLTIDLPLQQATERALASAGADTRGAAIVMDSHTGDLLALASAPAFDPNEFVPRLTSDTWRQLQDPKQRPLINRATQGKYPPGSIFKIVVGLACMEAGTLNPADKLYNPGYFRFPGRRPINDTASPGEYDFRRAFIKSSNTYFIEHGIKAGVQKILEMGQRLHLGEPSGIPNRQDIGGDFPNPKEIAGVWFDGDTANLSIGQGPISVTPLQMAVMTAAIANGGKVLWPRAVDRIEPQEPGGEIQRFPAAKVRDELNVKPQHMEILHQAMYADVEDPEGTGKNARVPGMHIGGKTGTAEVKQGRKVIDYITWFVAMGDFEKVEKPRYAVVVMVESGSSGGYTCAPIARQIFQAIQKRHQLPALQGKTLAQSS